MFQRATIALLAFILVLAIALAQPGLALLCALLLITAGMARQWSRWSLLRVSYERRLSQQRAFPDDEVELTIRVTNRKLLPLAGLRILDRVPSALALVNATTTFSGSRQSQTLQRRTSLRWYESVSWHYTLRCASRGTYRLGPVQMLSGDPFGLYGSDADHEVYTTLLVYPRLISLPELGLPARNPLGDMRAGQLLRDPLRTIGVRDYAPSDPLKDVHWAATARTGNLQTRVYEPTTSQVLAIFLDLDTFEFYYEGIDPELVERMISAAATVARAGLEAGFAVGLYANGAPAEYEHLARLPAGRSPAQLGQIMETLARLTAYSVTTISRVLMITTPDLHPGTTVMLIGAVNSEATRAALLRQRELGYRVSWLYMGDGEPPRIPGVRVIRAPRG
ncbi:DUF58 domain-containing protein [Oscillochloris sp. ZM17-4]|uniref:DUF58 domain-containing protein n=1 Tax=Oscillochloris sp. ZM17-4 TaxID=2866714 RepID=UPI001C730FEA|nr:DUF58 domain-containing protein [Oscillochloris sp. ZM17-4]MBX0327525.1 DUF58 domain-containing protein [Oscillochloris sp. ZM17-4]